MRQTRRFLLLLVLLEAVTFASAQIPNDSIVADFRYFIHQLEATHPDPYTNYGGKAFFHRAAHETLWNLKDDSVTTREELCWRIRAFLAPLRDGHTQIHYPETQGSFSLVPIRFKAVGDGLFVRRLPKGHQHLIGSRLLRRTKSASWQTSAVTDTSPSSLAESFPIFAKTQLPII